MIRLLSIGNSFSQDAHRYLAELAAAAGIELRAVNLYIGGCSLEQHWENAWRDAAVYSHEVNGESTGKSSLLQALREDVWDIITLQQVSQLAGLYPSYMPYLPGWPPCVGSCVRGLSCICTKPGPTKRMSTIPALSPITGISRRCTGRCGRPVKKRPRW